jgi:hypothetical protein
MGLGLSTRPSIVTRHLALFVNGSEGLAAGVPVNVVQEFWPQIAALTRNSLGRD